MNDTTRNRALNAFSAMGSLPDDTVLAAETALYEAESALYRPERAKGPFRRFLSSGLGVALISGIAALTAVALIIRAGQGPGVTPPSPIVPPVGSTIPVSDQQADFTISTDEKNYLPGTDRLTVVLTGRETGESISTVGVSWYLEKLADEGYESVDISFTEEVVISAEPSKGERATITKSIRVPDGLKGHYRLHATRYNGQEYESLTFCEFDALPDEEVGETSPHQLDFTISTDRETYEEGTTNFVVNLTGTRPGATISLPGEWHLYRITDEGTEPVIGMYYTGEAMDGLAPDEHTCATMTKRIFINPHNSDGGLRAGRYVLRAVTDEGYTECRFEVTAAEEAPDSEETVPSMGDMARFYLTDPWDAPLPDNSFYIQNPPSTER